LKLQSHGTWGSTPSFSRRWGRFSKCSFHLSAWGALAGALNVTVARLGQGAAPWLEGLARDSKTGPVRGEGTGRQSSVVELQSFCLAQGDLLVVIPTVRNEFVQCLLNKAMFHLRTAARAVLIASVPSTSLDLPERTAARRSRTSSKWARSTAGFASPARLARSFSTSNSRPLAGRFIASSATISTERAMLITLGRGHRLQACSWFNFGKGRNCRIHSGSVAAHAAIDGEGGTGGGAVLRDAFL